MSPQCLLKLSDSLHSLFQAGNCPCSQRALLGQRPAELEPVPLALACLALAGDEEGGWDVVGVSPGHSMRLCLPVFSTEKFLIFPLSLINNL